MSRWVSGDAATKTGVAIWEGSDCIWCGEFDQKAAAWRFWFQMSERGAEVEASIRRARTYGGIWRLLLGVGKTEALFLEASFASPKMMGTALALAFRRGYITAIADEICEVPRVQEVAVTQWRKVLGSWPHAKRGEKLPKGATKAYSVALANELSGWDFGAHDDAAESYLIGRAILKLGLIT